MPRKSIVELIAQAQASFPDNITGAITPALLRGMIEDFLHAIAPAYGVCQKTAPQTVSLGPTPIAFVYTTATSSDINQLTASAATGKISRSERGTSTINFTMDVDAANGRIVSAELFKNGVVTTWRVSVTCGGAGKPVGLALTAVDYADPAAEYEVRMSCDTAGTSTVLSNGALLLAVDAVNSYT